MDKYNFEQALHIIINHEYTQDSKTFRVASRIVWKELILISAKINPYKNDEMTSTLFYRLLNRRKRPFTPIATPRAYVYTAFKNIQKDIWRKEKQVQGYTNHLGEYQQHRSLDEYVLDSTQSLHEKIAAPLMDDPKEDDVLQLSALKEMIRTHLYGVTPKQIRCKSPKGKKTFLKAAKRFQEFSEGTYTIKEATPYKQFDRQRHLMLEHLQTQLPSTKSEAFQYIMQYVDDNDLCALRHAKIEEAREDKNLNPEIVHRQIEAEIAFRSLFAYISANTSLPGTQVQDLLLDPTAAGLFAHCQYQLFYLEMFRTKKKKKNGLESMYCQFV